MRKKVVCSPLLAVGVLCVVVASALPALGSAVASSSSCQLSINDEEVVDGMGSVGQKLNVLGTALQKCSRPGGPTTGFYRDGCCTTGDSDYGRHVVCARMTQVSGPTQPRRGVGIARKIFWEETARGRLSIPRSTRDLPAIPRLTPILSFSLSSTCPCCRQAFLEFTRSRGNDLSSPAPQYGFPGLRPGDFWCLCASRWQEAFESGAAPQVVLESTHEAALRYCKLEDLQENAFVEDTIEL